MAPDESATESDDADGRLGVDWPGDWTDCDAPTPMAPFHHSSESLSFGGGVGDGISVRTNVVWDGVGDGVTVDYGFGA